MKWDEVGALPCSMARSLALLGDRWTLMVLRSLFMGMRRFDDFQTHLGVTRHVLSDRLSRLVEDGVLHKVPYMERPLRHEYRLTDMGRDLYPVMQALNAWGDKWLDGGHGAPLEFHHSSCGHRFTPLMVCSHCREPVDYRNTVPMAGPGLAMFQQRLKQAES
ncbi:winged helix-turn-helix transcriptional regulator [Isoalcanivorax beigongshangi]|uniref:Winged helix-turn-helix transcriptional regulator n=1 Tax=Isoalcanivorax beigongshangi TaxID=3238810 RepID=A0ABV4AGE6_9GAMM